MGKIRLFIENQEIELNESVQFNITKQFEDLTNPTVIISDWSKTVSIPFSQKNDKIFEYIYNPDKHFIQGIGFDPLKKLDFRLENNDSVIMEGYAKMNSITRTGGNGTYNITLNGQLGKLFQEYKKITFGNNNEVGTDKYRINGSQYYDEYINKDLIYNSWTNNRTDEDIIGWAPNNNKFDGFDYNTIDTVNNATGIRSAKKFSEVLDKVPRWQDNNPFISGESAVPNGLLPREIGEFRSYQQLPFIYMPKLWKVFQDKAEYIGGYNFELDNRWFNIDNPYWNDLVYMLKPLNVKDAKTDSVNSDISVESPINNYYNIFSTDLNFNSSLKDTDGYYHLPEDTETLSIKGSFYIHTRKYPPYELSQFDFITGIKATYKLLNENNEVIKTYKVGVGSKNEDMKTYDNFNIFYDYSEEWFRISEVHQQTVLDINFSNEVVLYLDKKTIEERLPHNRYRVTIELRPISNYPVITLSASKDGGGSRYVEDNLPFVTYSGGATITTGTAASRSNSRITLNTLWDNEVNLFDEILRYCKTFGIIVDVNNVTKKIKFIQRADYMKDYIIEDWTDKVDFGKDFIIQPLTCDKRYINFDYTGDSALNTAYKEKYNENYGQAHIETIYKFNSETEDIIKGGKLGIISTDNLNSWKTLYEDCLIIYTVAKEGFVNAKDKDNKYTNIFGAWFFYNGNRQFDNSESLPEVYISDDTYRQNLNNTYYYSGWLGSDIDPDTGETYRIDVTTYPWLSAVDRSKKLMSTYYRPLVEYATIESYGNALGIIGNIWFDYLTERYLETDDGYNIIHPQNKIVTCYVNLSLIDFSNFRFNRFITIGDTLYFVNKIYDFDCNSDSLTKVDLITVNNIKNYIEIYYKYLYLSKHDENKIMPYNQSVNFTFEIISNADIFEIKSISSNINDCIIDGNLVIGNTKPTSNLEGFYTVTVGISGTNDYNRTYTLHLYTPPVA